MDNQGSFLSSLTGKTAKDFDTGDAKFIPYMNVYSNTFTNILDLRTVNVSSVESQNAVAKGDVFFTISSEVPEEAGMSSVLLDEVENCYLNSFCTLFRFDYGKSPNPVFLGYLLRSALVRAHLSRGAQGATRYNIPKEAFRILPLQLPSDSEQQKIADCLRSLDDLIATEGRKLDALQLHKLGLVQQIFPRPGESMPRFRFPEFENGPNWRPRELGLMTSKIGSGITPRGGEKKYQSSGRPFIRSQNIGWGELILDNVAYIDEDTHASFAATEVEKGDVLLNISGASIGRSAVADARIACGNVNQHVCIIRCLSEQMQAYFLSQYLISKHGQDQIDSYQAGGNRQGLNFGQIRSFLIPQPRDIAEQECIADCLRTADTILATQSQRISTLKRQKQGLLQQLFPSLVED